MTALYYRILSNFQEIMLHFQIFTYNGKGGTMTVTIAHDITSDKSLKSKWIMIVLIHK